MVRELNLLQAEFFRKVFVLQVLFLEVIKLFLSIFHCFFLSLLFVLQQISNYALFENIQIPLLILNKYQKAPIQDYINLHIYQINKHLFCICEFHELLIRITLSILVPYKKKFPLLTIQLKHFDS